MNNKTLLTTASLFACSVMMASAADVAAPAALAPAPEINTLADISVISGVLERFSVSASVDYESEFIFRGKQLADAVVCPEVDIAYDIGSGFGAYIGWWGCYSTDDKTSGMASYQENDLYAGITYEIEGFTFDFGYTAYTYPASSGVTENEIKLIASYDTSEYLGDFAIVPYVAGFYNFTYSGTVIEAGLAYSAPVTAWLLGENWGSIDVAAYGAYADYKGGMSDGGYAYAGFAADAVVAVTDFWTISAGIRYACNNDSPDGTKENMLWFGVATGIGF